jgi:hypothetical protein
MSAEERLTDLLSGESISSANEARSASATPKNRQGKKDTRRDQAGNYSVVRGLNVRSNL